MSVVLCGKQFVSGVALVLGSRHRHPLAYGVAADNGTAGMDARTAYGALQHLGIFNGVGKQWVGACLGIAQLWHTLDGVGQIHLHSVGQLVGYCLAQAVAYVERQLLHTGNVLDGVLGGHCAIGYDVRHLVVAVLVLHPLQYFTTTIIVEVGIDIREGDTVGVKKTLEQQVVLYRVYLGDAKTISHHRTGSRSTARPHHHAELVASRVDEVLHNEEVARETHGLHNVQLKLDALVHLVRQRVAVELLCSVVGKLSKIVGLKLYSVELFQSAELLNLLLGFLVRHNLVAVLVGCKLAEQLFGRYALACLFLRTKLFGYGEERHDRRMVDGIELHLVQYLKSVAQSLGHIREDSVHLLARLEPLLLRVEHAVRVVEVLSGGKTQQVVVRLGIVLVDKVAVVGAYKLHAILACKVDKLLVGTLLQWEGFAVGTLVRVFHLVALQLEVVVVAKHTLIPLQSLSRSSHIALQYLRRHLAGNTCRAHNKVLVILLKVFAVGTWAHIIAVYPSTRHELD